MAIILPETFQFLKDLERNNDRQWFAAHKDEYQGWLANGKEFLKALTDEMNKFDQIEKSKLFRIYKDVRFSKDKTPYNKHMSMSFNREKPYLRGGYYLRIEKGESLVACGFWNPAPSDLALIRGNIDLDAKTMRKAMSEASIKKYFNPLEGDAVKTSPKGYSKDHPEIELLRYKSFFFTRNFTDKEVLDKSFIKEVVKSYKAIRPFFEYMSEILGHNLNGEPLY
ncbi:MAG: hypothetical protein ACI9FN_000148 [Saprospiraceae bacterium]|jgi:uncharacterized protein (TIGR02453 family)